MQELYKLFPQTVQSRLKEEKNNLEQFQEIRLRIGRGAAFCKGGKRYWLLEEGGLCAETKYYQENAFVPEKLRYPVTKEDMEIFLAACSQHSLYAFTNQMKQGFLTIRGGHRIGFAGSVFEENNHISGFSEIGSVNVRIAHEVKGCGLNVLGEITENGKLYNTLIISPPGFGKTTLLRDLIRLISEGNQFCPPLTVAVSDERGELGACYLGNPELDLGCNTDIIDGGNKAENLWLMLRTLGPQVIAMDEIGGVKEKQLLLTARQWGVGLLASMHGYYHVQEIRQRSEIRNVFERVIELKRTKNNDFDYRVYVL